MKKNLLSALMFASFASQAQNVYIPDANFKNALLGNGMINTIPDTEISNAEAAAFNGTIDVSNLSIADLTGIEAFTGTIYLNCGGNLLTTVDLSANTGLSGILHLDYNQLTSITFPPTSYVTLVHINNNPIGSVNISSLQTMTNLYAMNCYNLTSLDVSANTNLVVLNIAQTDIGSIDLTGLVNLQSIITSYTLISGTLDLSPCTSLTYIDCTNMDYLNELNIQNGNNMSVPPGGFTATGCPNLTCVQVDNVAFANAVWSSAVDPGVSFALDCSSSIPMATSMTIQGQGGASTISTPGGTLIMEATVLPSNASQSVNWGIVSGGQYASIAANGVLTALADGVVTVGAMTTDGSNITATTDITISGQTSGLNAIQMEAHQVYPNPASSSIHIESSNEVESVHIFDVRGNLVMQFTGKEQSILTLENGVYFITVRTKNGLSQSKFIKQ